MDLGLKSSYDSMCAWRTRVCHRYIDGHHKVATVGRRKPPIQTRRDRDRMEQYRNLPVQEMVLENNSSRQYNKDENLNRICKDDSALHSISFFETALPARREKAQDDVQQKKKKKARQFNIISNRY